MRFPFTQSIDFSRLHAYLIDEVILLPFFDSFTGYFVARTPFPTEISTLREIAHPAIRKLFKVSLISVIR